MIYETKNGAEVHEDLIEEVGRELRAGKTPEEITQSLLNDYCAADAKRIIQWGLGASFTQ